MQSLQKAFTRYAVMKTAVRVPLAQFASTPNRGTIAKDMNRQNQSAQETDFGDLTKASQEEGFSKNLTKPESGSSKHEQTQQDKGFDTMAKDLGGQHTLQRDQTQKQWKEKDINKEDWQQMERLKQKGDKGNRSQYEDTGKKSFSTNNVKQGDKNLETPALNSKFIEKQANRAEEQEISGKIKGQQPMANKQEEVSSNSDKKQSLTEKVSSFFQSQQKKFFSSSSDLKQDDKNIETPALNSEQIEKQANRASKQEVSGKVEGQGPMLNKQEQVKNNPDKQKLSQKDQSFSKNQSRKFATINNNQDFSLNKDQTDSKQQKTKIGVQPSHPQATFLDTDKNQGLKLGQKSVNEQFVLKDQTLGQSSLQADKGQKEARDGKTGDQDFKQMAAQEKGKKNQDQEPVDRFMNTTTRKFSKLNNYDMKDRQAYTHKEMTEKYDQGKTKDFKEHMSAEGGKDSSTKQFDSDFVNKKGSSSQQSQEPLKGDFTSGDSQTKQNKRHQELEKESLKNLKDQELFKSQKRSFASRNESGDLNKSNPFGDRERAMEKQYFTKEDEENMRKLMKKMRQQFSDNSNASQEENTQKLEEVMKKHNLKGNKSLYNDLFQWKNY